MKKAIEIKIPIIPSFIKVGTTFIGIEEFTEAELRHVGKEWARLLVEKAKRRADSTLEGVNDK